MQAKRWMGERPWPWLDNNRAFIRDDQRLPENREDMIDAVMIWLRLRQLENHRRRWKTEEP